MMSAQDDLIQQILGQNLTSKWSGGYGAQDSATAMAKLMADAGITDIKQFGKVPVYEQADSRAGFQGQLATFDGDNYYIMVPGGVDSEGNPYNSRQNVDPSQLTPIYGKTISTPEGETVTSTFQPLDPSQIVMKDGVPTYKARDTFGNKETGQAINRGSGRWEGQGGDNLFSGTGAGKGNTGFRVNFADDGTPIFYTTQGSSSDLGQIAPLLAIAQFIPGLQPFAMAANAAIAAHQGNPLGAIAGLAGLGGYTDVANAARLGSALKSGDPLAIALSGANLGGVTDVGGVNLGDVSKGIGAAKAIKSGDPLALLRYGMGALPTDDSLASSIGPGNMDEFKENLIPGYFQPGGEGYITPTETETPTGPGYINEMTGEFISDPLGGLQGPLGPETGNIDPNQEWEYSLTKPGVWTNKDGEEIDVSYMPDRDTAMTGKELMEKAGAMPGGIKAPTKSPAGGAKPATPGTTPGTKPAIPGVKTGATGNPAVDAITNLANQQQQYQNSVLNMMMNDKNEVANIKSFKDLYGGDLFGGSYVPPSALGMPAGGNVMMPQQNQDEQDNDFFDGGHVDDIDVDALLRILRS